MLRRRVKASRERVALLKRVQALEQEEADAAAEAANAVDRAEKD